MFLCQEISHCRGVCGKAEAACLMPKSEYSLLDGFGRLREYNQVVTLDSSDSMDSLEYSESLS